MNEPQQSTIQTTRSSPASDSSSTSRTTLSGTTATSAKKQQNHSSSSRREDPTPHDRHHHEGGRNRSTAISPPPPAAAAGSPFVRQPDNSATSSNSSTTTNSSKWRPLDILQWSAYNSTRLIGWNDEDFRKVLEEHHRRRREDPSIPNIEETGFGLMGILTSTIKEAVYKKTDFDDLKSDLKAIEHGGVASSSSPSKMQQKNSPGGDTLNEGSKKESSSIDIIGSKVNVKEMKVYKNILSAIKYQRDAYFMGTEHAETRKLERESNVEQQQHLQQPQQRQPLTVVPKPTDAESADSLDPTYQQSHSHAQQEPIMKQSLPQDQSQQSATISNSSSSSSATEIASYKHHLDRYPTVHRSSLGYSQLTGLLTWFIPSQTVHSALMPTVLWTIAPPTHQLPDGGPLRRKINRSVCDLIPLSQSLLDVAMKDSILWVLRDEAWRETVKGSSRNYLTATDGNATTNGGGTPSASSNLGQPGGTGGRVVITKTVRIV